MLGFVLRLLGCVALAAGVAVAIGDIARTLGADEMRLSSIAQVLSLLSADDGGPGLAASLEGLGAVGTLILGWPASPALAVFGIVLLIAGRRPAAPRLSR